MPIQIDNEQEDKSERELGELHKQEEEDLVRVLANAKYSLPYVNLAGQMIENAALRFATEEEARSWGVAPFKIVGKVLHIGVRTPEKQEVHQFKEKILADGYTPYFYLVSLSSLQKVWDRYKELSYASTSRAGGIDISGDTVKELAEKIKSIPDVAREITSVESSQQSHRISHIMEALIAGAISLGVSDIHIEPYEDSVRIRYRLDGVLQEVLAITVGDYHLLNSRIKLVSGLKLTAQQVNQDGGFSIFLDDMELRMRVSVVPGPYGESTVMRILDPRSIQVKLEDMGIDPKLFVVIERALKRPQGLIYITGPTGSGKTTTLYAFLQRLYNPEIKIITIEDPIEYHLRGITQTQTEAEKGYTFFQGLRAALRQDPDIIMIGETRDPETAKIAVESALTGHLVFSTLHTNNCAGVIPRLIDLEVNPKILVSALSLSMAQRLVRKLCTFCRSEQTPTTEQEQILRKIISHAAEVGKDIAAHGLSKDMPFKIWTPVGCEKCNKTGYKGRMGIFEAIETNEDIEKIIPTNPSERDIRRVAEKQGIFDMREDGVIKILKGITSLDEVQSVVDLVEEL